MRIFDAGWGQRGFFTLLEDEGQVFVHYSTPPHGYSVFQTAAEEERAIKIHNLLADVIDIEREKDRRDAVEQAEAQG